MWRERLISFARQHDHPAWGIAHSERIYRLALTLCEGQAEVDDDALFAAAYLHDVGAFAAFREDGVDHAERAHTLIPRLLADFGFPAEKAIAVQAIARGHMFSARPAPRVEAVALHDADTLDFLGAVGIARLLAIVRLSDWTPDLRSAVERIERFARELPACLYTPRARLIAAARVRETEAFLSALADETFGLTVL